VGRENPAFIGEGMSKNRGMQRREKGDAE